jgi:hypothetical protein
MKKRVLFLFFLTLFLISNISALRISPARVDGNFNPGMEIELEYTVSSNLNRDLEVYVKGDLAEYVELSKNKLFKEGTFTVKFELPDTLDPPGLKRTIIGVRELVDEELAGGIGTSVAIEASVNIFVPYPGKYLESDLRAHNVNLGEPITFELDVASRGKEDVTMKPRIEIYSEYGELIETLYFKERFIESQERVELIKIMNTTSYFSGDYYALSKVDYDTKTSESRTDFKIGELSIEIINYTKQILVGGLRKFEIEIVSGWNDRIDGAYGEVVILNGSEKLTEFKTSPTDLSPWGSKIITGYLDATDIPLGVYDTDITVIYYGRDRGESTNKMVKVEFVEEEKTNYLIIGGIIILAILAVVILIYIFKNVKKKKK